MDYPDWKETRDGMWAAELKFPMIDDETPTFMGRPYARTKTALMGADVVIIGAPYNSGLLANAERRRATYDYKPAPDHLWEKAQKIREVCSGHSVDMRAAALQYPLRHPAVAAVIPGRWSEEEVQTNLRLMSVDIPSALWTELDDAGLVRGLSDSG